MIYRVLGRTGGRYCLPGEHGVDIPGVFERFNWGRVYGLWTPARRAYQWLVKEKKAADDCAECGACEERCPQHLPIRAQLKEAHAALSSPAPSVSKSP